MPDERTYGFNLRDATELVNGIGSGEGWYPEIKPRGSGGGNGSGGIRYYQFELTSSVWGTVSPNNTWNVAVKILEMDGTLVSADETLLDPIGMATSLMSGDRGYALRQDGNYYFVNAECPSVEYL
jgi:hypothetical protein